MDWYCRASGREIEVIWTSIITTGEAKCCVVADADFVTSVVPGFVLFVSHTFVDANIIRTRLSGIAKVAEFPAILLSEWSVLLICTESGLEGVAVGVFINAWRWCCKQTVDSWTTWVSGTCELSGDSFKLTVGFGATITRILDKFTSWWQCSVLGTFALATVKTNSSVLADTLELTAY